MTSSFITYRNEKYLPIPGPPLKDINFLDVQFYVSSNFSKSSDIPEVRSIENYTHYFIKESDLSSYLSQVIKSPENTSQDNLFNTLSSNMDALLHNLKESQFSPESLKLFNEYSTILSSQLQSQSIVDLVKIVVNGQNLNRTLFITILTQFVAKAMGWSNENNLKKLMMASFLCDIAKEDSDDFDHIPKALILLENAKLHSDIILSVKHHHEYQNGSGAYRIKRHHIHPFAKVITVCDDFYDFFIVKRVTSGLQFLNNNAPDKYDSGAVIALSKLFKFKP